MDIRGTRPVRRRPQPTMRFLMVALPGSFNGPGAGSPGETGTTGTALGADESMAMRCEAEECGCMENGREGKRKGGCARVATVVHTYQ